MNKMTNNLFNPTQKNMIALKSKKKKNRKVKKFILVVNPINIIIHPNSKQFHKILIVLIISYIITIIWIIQIRMEIKVIIKIKIQIVIVKIVILNK